MCKTRKNEAYITLKILLIVKKIIDVWGSSFSSKSKKWFQLSRFLTPKMLIILEEIINQIIYISLNYVNDHRWLFGGQIWKKTEFSFSLLQLESHIEKCMPALQVERRDQLNFLKKFNCEITEMDDNTSFFPFGGFFFYLHFQGKSIKDFREYLFYYQYYCEDVSNITFSMSVGGPKFLLNL